MLRRIKWAMFGLAGLLGVLAFAIGEEPHPGLVTGFGVALGLSGIARGQVGVEDGSIRGRSRQIARDENPIAFWFVVGLHYVAGLALAIGAMIWNK